MRRWSHSRTKNISPPLDHTVSAVVGMTAGAVLVTGRVTNFGFLKDIRGVVGMYLGKHVLNNDAKIITIIMPLSGSYRPLGDITNLTLAKPDMSKTDISTVNCLLLITVYHLVGSFGEAAMMHFGAALRIAHALQEASVKCDSADFFTRKRLWTSVRTLDLDEQLRQSDRQLAPSFQLERCPLLTADFRNPPVHLV